MSNKTSTKRIENTGHPEDVTEDIKLQLFLSEVNNNGGRSDDDETRMFRKNLLIPPNSTFMSVWDWFTVMFLLFTAIVTPFEVAFIQTNLTNPLFWINRVVDLFFITDMTLTFFIPYRDPESNVWVTSHRAISKRYLRSWFIIDLLSILPFDILGVVLASDSVQNVKALRLIRLLRLIKLLRLFRTSRVIGRWSPLIPIRYSVMSLVKFAFAMLMTAHWLACLLGIIPDLESSSWDDLTPAEIAAGQVPVNWQVAYFEGSLGYSRDSYGVWTIYLGGFYLAAMTLTTIGYGDVVAKTDPERGIMLLVMFVGGGFYAFAIGNIFGIVSSMDPLTSEFHDTMDDLNDFMSEVDLPTGLRKRVRRYFHFTLYHRRAVNNAELISNLTPSLKSVTAYIVNKGWVDQLPFLSIDMIGDDRELVVRLGELFKHRACGARERIVTAGDILDRIYVVERGAVLLHTTKSVMDASLTVEDKLSPHMYVQKSLDPFVRQELVSGTCFGHEVAYAINSDVRPSYSVTTIAYTELHYIEKADFLAVIRKFPTSYEKLKTLAIRREWTKHKIIPTTSAVIPKEFIDVPKLETEVQILQRELETLRNVIAEKDARMKSLIS